MGSLAAVLGGCLVGYRRQLPWGCLILEEGSPLPAWAVETGRLGARRGAGWWKAGWIPRPALRLRSAPAQVHCALPVQGHGVEGVGTQNPLASSLARAPGPGLRGLRPGLAELPVLVPSTSSGICFLHLLSPTVPLLCSLEAVGCLLLSPLPKRHCSHF